MEGESPPGEVVSIRFALASHNEICTASISECPISHVSQLSNPFLGLPLECGKCESCGTSEPGKCEGHFGYIELPTPIYHPGHVSELKHLLSLLCLKCLKMKKAKSSSGGLAERLLAACCEEASHISVRDASSEGACYLELKLPSRSRLQDGCWNFLERYGYRYGNDHIRPLLAREVKEILKRIPAETRKKLAAKGYFPQEGYIVEYLPVPPNCLSVPDVSDGFISMSSDPARSELKDVLKKVIAIKHSRSGETNFECHKIEADDIYKAVAKYLEVRGTSKTTRNIDMRYGVTKVSDVSSTKAWLEKMRTLFIKKGSGFSSRSVITGDAYRRVDEVGVPYEIAQRMTFEERVSVHNLRYLQELVDNGLCLTYTEGSTTYSLRDGSKGHTLLKPGQIVHRKIKDGDVVFINRPPTTHKHSLQALRIYIHEDHTVKINPLICGPLSADFDGDCVHLFYPQSLAAKAEVMELFSVEKQLLSSHSGQLNLQLGCDSVLALRVLFERLFLDKIAFQQLAMLGSHSFLPPALRKCGNAGPLWTALQVLQLALPERLSCRGDRYLIQGSDLLEFDFGSEAMASVINGIVASIVSEKGPKEALRFFDLLQPLLMEHLFAEGFSVSLEDLSMSEKDMKVIHRIIQDIVPVLSRLRLSYEDELQLENSFQRVKGVAANFMRKSYSLRNLIDFKSDSSINKLVQQIGFLGLQLSDKKKFYTKNLVEDMAHFCQTKYPKVSSSGEFGLVKSCFFHGLDPYEEITHATAAREVLVRSSRGLAEPGTLFKNLMAVLRDIVVSYDGTVRNTSSNSVVQFKYENKSEHGCQSMFPAGEPVGVLAATAMSNPAYKAVLDSTPNSNSSWELMKEVLLCKVKFQNTCNDRRVVLYLNKCRCGGKYCQEKAASTVITQLKKISLKDAAKEFLVEYKKQQTISENFGLDSCLLGHIHLNKMMLQELNISMHEVLQKCEDKINALGQKKKKKADDLKRTTLSVSECCFFPESCAGKDSDVSCLTFTSHNPADPDLERTLDVLCNTIYPVLLETVIKGDPRICSANIIWNSPDMTTWIRNRHANRWGELVLDITVEKSDVKQSGDAWRIVMDSCIPVLHLIDTKRSIPYAIKQVQDLLGISCAFEQAVQRLSASVRMVSKGVLKEHLILLANIMTCSGNMLGFNSGGYKALTRSLNILAPFTEATLITPKRCFEKAAEKCYKDPLSTVVGSCSWGNRVAVGTGSRFDLLWNQKEAYLNDDGGIDVYNFLHMVRSGTNGDVNASSPGFDVDDFVTEGEMAEWAESPERDSALKFEDSGDFQNILDEGQPAGSNWDKVSAGEDNGSWGGKTDWGSSKTADRDQTTSSGGWEKGTDVDKEDTWCSWKSNNKSDAQEPSKSGAWEEPVDGWGSKPKDDNRNTSSWVTHATEMDSFSVKEDEPSSDPWGSKRMDDNTNTSKWGTNANNKDSSATEEDGPGCDAWGSKSVSDMSWGQKKSESAPKDWNSERDASTDVWGQRGSPRNNEKESNTWSISPKEPNATEGTYQSDKEAWGVSKESTCAWNQPSSGNAWQQSRKESSADAWNQLNSGNDGHTWEKSTERSGNSNGLSWGEPEKGEENRNDDLWASRKEPSPTAWNSSNKHDINEDDKNPWVLPEDSDKGDTNENEKFQWGSSKRYPSDGSRGGWSKGNSDWKGKSNRPPRPPGTGNGDNLAPMFTATRQRLDMFTSEEQDILADVDLIMKTVRRIMHQSGYTDGDPIPAEDQAFVLEKVLNFHPDKASKLSDGVDFITVDKHTSFQDTRCFFIVSTDGSRKDFSYKKCLDNFIKEKYPDLAEEFISKYFRKPHPGGNRDRSQQEASPKKPACEEQNSMAEVPGCPTGEEETLQ
ncbi:PREDICTED: DNA-directed RNA polymerase V subunit 1 [Tarenaya hassleriana]|uniref:DNA-directed RNA polymerase V subunit 1 n=1 Tax=Tarenaya hassleriana TaxID=28532 RepID=UPI00053C07FE|nr:PREDICTED: DNA-directed RNA polymerase V subunit 1 [Tarenaya hassleriana]